MKYPKEIYVQWSGQGDDKYLSCDEDAVSAFDVNGSGDGVVKVAVYKLSHHAEIKRETSVEKP